MKIWLANHYAVPPHMGGITRHFELGNEWAKKEDAKVSLWMTNFIHSRHSYLTQEEREKTDRSSKVKCHWIWSPTYKGNDRKRIINMVVFAFLFFFKGLFTKRPDVIVASSPHLLTGLAGCLLAKWKKCPFVFEVRDLWPEGLVLMGGIQNQRVVRILTRIERFLYKHADRIVVLTEYQRKYIVDKGFKREKIELIPNGVVADMWQRNEEKRKEYRAKLGVSDDTFLAIYTGAHGPINALDAVVNAAQYTDDKVLILLVGDGPDKKRLMQLKEEKGLDNVRFLDSVAKPDIYNYTQAADAGIISVKDNEIFRGGRPNKLFDYAFVGVPIITNNDGEVRELVEEHRLGLFSGVEDPKGMADAIEAIRHYSAERRAEIKENGQRFIDEQGDRRKLAKKYYRILEDLVNN